MTTTLDAPTMAREIGVTTHSVRRWIQSGQLPATTCPRGREQQVYLVWRSVWEAFTATRLASKTEIEGEAVPVPLIYWLAVDGSGREGEAVKGGYGFLWQV